MIVTLTLTLNRTISFDPNPNLLVWWYLLEVTHTVTEFGPRIGRVTISLLTQTYPNPNPN